MEMIQFLEADKEQLRSALAQAGTPDQAQGVLEKEFDKLLLRYNEECTEERLRDTARYIMQAAKMMIPLLSAAGETRVWSRSAGSGSSDGGGGVKMTMPVIASMVGGIVFLVGALLGLAVSAGQGLSLSALLGSIPAAILGGALLFISGRFSNGNKSAAAVSSGSGDQQVEIRVNPDLIWNCTRGVILSADKSLQEAQETVKYERSQLSASVGNGISPEESDLFANILESCYSLKEENPDEPSILETISMVRYYLHRKQIETVDFGNGKREWFELLPGKQQMTLRPALVRDGTLIRKGLAVAAQ